MIGIDEWGLYRLSGNSRHKILSVVGADLMRVLDRLGQTVNSAASGNRWSRREIRRIRVWCGPKHWRALCLMLYGGRVGSYTPKVRSSDCVDALLMVLDLESEKIRWGMQ